MEYKYICKSCGWKYLLPVPRECLSCGAQKSKIQAIELEVNNETH